MANAFSSISFRAAHDLFKAHPKTFTDYKRVLTVPATHVKALSDLGGVGDVKWLARKSDHGKLLAKYNAELEAKFIKAGGIDVKPGSFRPVWAPRGTTEMPYDELDNKFADFSESKLSEVPFEIKGAVFLTKDNVKTGIICGTRSFADIAITVSDLRNPEWGDFKAVEAAGNLCPGAEGFYKASFGNFIDRKQGNNLDHFFLDQFLGAYKSLPGAGPFLLAHHSAGGGLAAPLMLKLNAIDKDIKIVSVGFSPVVSIDAQLNEWFKKQGHTAIAVCDGIDPVSRIRGPWGIANGIAASIWSVWGSPPPDSTASRAAAEMAACKTIHIGQELKNNKDATTLSVSHHPMSNYLEAATKAPEGFSTDEGKTIKDFYAAAMAYK